MFFLCIVFAGVFAIRPGPKISYNQAVAHCKAKGATLATLKQLNTAWEAGMNHCVCGWTTDKKAHWPITFQTCKQCGEKPGVHTCAWVSTYWEAYCYKKE